MSSNISLRVVLTSFGDDDLSWVFAWLASGSVIQNSGARARAYYFTYPIGSMYGIFIYIHHHLPLNLPKCR